MSAEYHVPRFLWENFESVLLAQSKRYIGELAKILRVPEKELIKKVLPTDDSIRVIIQDSEERQCCAYIQYDALTVFCKKPVAYQSEFCTYHRTKRMTVVEGMNPIVIQRIKDHPGREPLWVQGASIIQSNGNRVGTIDVENQTMTLFVIE
jgi:hypothetical protein